MCVCVCMCVCSCLCMCMCMRIPMYMYVYMFCVFHTVLKGSLRKKLPRMDIHGKKEKKNRIEYMRGERREERGEKAVEQLFSMRFPTLLSCIHGSMVVCSSVLALRIGVAASLLLGAAAAPVVLFSFATSCLHCICVAVSMLLVLQPHSFFYALLQRGVVRIGVTASCDCSTESMKS